MSNRTDKNEIIVSPINDARLKPGMNRSRSGTTQLFGGTTHEPEITLTPPEKHLYALEVKGVWMWVNGCGHCNQNGEKMSYVVCEEHDRCQCCGVNRKDAITIPPRSEHDIGGGVWGSRDGNGIWGWTCHTCHKAEEERVRSEALARIADNTDYNEWDYFSEDVAKCPWCNAKVDTEESYDADGDELTCDECGHSFTLTAEHTVTWTTKRQEAAQ